MAKVAKPGSPATARPSSPQSFSAKASAARPSRLVLHPSHEVLSYCDKFPPLVHHFDIAARPALSRVDLDDRVGKRDGVTDVDGTEKAHPVVAQRDGRFVAGRAMALVDHHARAGRGEAD